MKICPNKESYISINTIIFKEFKNKFRRVIKIQDKNWDAKQIENP